jgi:hypothetical protein
MHHIMYTRLGVERIGRPSLNLYMNDICICVYIIHTNTDTSHNVYVPQRGENWPYPPSIYVWMIYVYTYIWYILIIHIHHIMYTYISMERIGCTRLLWRPSRLFSRQVRVFMTEEEAVACVCKCGGGGGFGCMHRESTSRFLPPKPLSIAFLKVQFYTTWRAGRSASGLHCVGLNRNTWAI